MTKIKATCAACGEVNMVASKFTLSKYPNGDYTYSFVCPHCNELTVKPAGPEVRRLLEVAMGIKREFLPAEIGEEHLGAPLTEDDLLDFIVQLNVCSDERLIELAGGAS